jgi:hypothetical protein
MNTKKNTKDVKTYKILQSFSGEITDTWPIKTDILCWWCCNNFDTVPLPCPVDYDHIKQRYKMNGVFCSWGCVSAYSIENFMSLCLVYQLKNELIGDDNYDEDIYVSPPRYCLKEFGGHMDINEFRSGTEQKKNLIISSIKFNYINQEIIESKACR